MKIVLESSPPPAGQAVVVASADNRVKAFAIVELDDQNRAYVDVDDDVTFEAGDVMFPARLDDDGNWWVDE